MSILAKTINEQLSLAQSSTDIETLLTLSYSTYMNVRRAVAQNRSTDMKTLEKLILDPTQNVSFVACQNPNINSSRRFDESLHACVLCTERENSSVCQGCDKKLDYYYK